VQDEADLSAALDWIHRAGSGASSPASSKLPSTQSSGAGPARRLKGAFSLPPPKKKQKKTHVGDGATTLEKMAAAAIGWAEVLGIGDHSQSAAGG